jgi:hypothetical protein
MKKYTNDIPTYEMTKISQNIMTLHHKNKNSTGNEVIKHFGDVVAFDYVPSNIRFLRKYIFTFEPDIENIKKHKLYLCLSLHLQLQFCLAQKTALSTQFLMQPSEVMSNNTNVSISHRSGLVDFTQYTLHTLYFYTQKKILQKYTNSSG